MRHFGGQCQCVLFSEVRILGDAAFERKPIDHHQGERGILQGVITDIMLKKCKLFLKIRYSDLK